MLTPTRLSVLLLVLYLFVSLSPILRSGYYSDDRSYATITRGYHKLHSDLGFWDIAQDCLKQSASHGRFLPVSTYLIRTIYYAVNNLAVYKSYLLLLAVGNVLLFYFLIRAVTGDELLSQLSVLIVAVLFQFRANSHEPLVSLHGLIQWVCIFTMGSLLYLHRHLKHGHPGTLGGSVLLYLMALLTYEFSLLLWPLHLAMIFSHRKDVRRTVKLLAPFVVLAAGAGAGTVVLRAVMGEGTTQYEGTRFSADLGKVAKTYLLQLYATLPLTSLHFHLRDTSLLYRARIMAEAARVDFAVYTALFMAVSLGLARRMKAAARAALSPVALVLGFLLVVLPGPLVAVSAKYQREIVLGLGYVPVYMQCFGLSLLLSSVVLYVCTSTRCKTWARHAVPVFFVAAYTVGSLNLLNNKVRVDEANYWRHNPNEAFRLAAASGMFNDLPEDSTFLLNRKSVWYVNAYSFLMYEHTDTKFRCSSLAKYQESVRRRTPPSVVLGDSNVYVVRFRPCRRGAYRFELGKIESIHYRKQTGKWQVNVSKYWSLHARQPDYRYVSAWAGDSRLVKRLNDVQRAAARAYEWGWVTFPDKGADFNSTRIF